MNRILLTSTALVMVAGIAAADGHASITWSATATAGVARAGGTEAAAAVAAATTSTAQMRADYKTRSDRVAGGGYTAGSFGTVAGTNVGDADVEIATYAGLAPTPAELVALRTSNTRDLATAITAAFGNKIGIAAANAAYAKAEEELTFLFGKAATTKADAGDFKPYHEINAAVKGSVTAGGITVTAQLSVDAGEGYDFADDDTFDVRPSGTVGMDSVTVDMGSIGTISLNDNGVTHLVDGDDDAAGDVSYTNSFGGATFTAVVDLAKVDSDVVSSNKGVGTTAAADAAATATTAIIALGDFTAGAAAVAPDVQWSAKVAMPLGAGSVYVAMDEEGGNAFGGSAMLSGATVTVDSKLEALESDLKKNRSSTLGVSYVMGAVTAGATYNSVKDGDQWGVSASYAAGDMTVGFSTDEGSDWSVTGGYALGGGASIDAGVNYTEDAYLGLSFAF